MIGIIFRKTCDLGAEIGHGCWTRWKLSIGSGSIGLKARQSVRLVKTGRCGTQLTGQAAFYARPSTYVRKAITTSGSNSGPQLVRRRFTYDRPAFV